MSYKNRHTVHPELYHNLKISQYRSDLLHPYCVPMATFQLDKIFLHCTLDYSKQISMQHLKFAPSSDLLRSISNTILKTADVLSFDKIIKKIE